MRSGQDCSSSGRRESQPVRRKETGQVLALVIILLLFGGLLATPLLAYMYTAIKSGSDVEARVLELYAADSGFEDALLRVGSTPPGATPTPSPYYCGPTLTPGPSTFNYCVDNEAPPGPDLINGEWVQVTMQRQWMLEGIVDLPPGQRPHSEWVVAGLVQRHGNKSEYVVTATYDGTVNSKNAKLEEVGAYLPAPYEYEPGSTRGDMTKPGDEPDVEIKVDNGTVYIWEFDGKGSNPPAVEFPKDAVTAMELTFDFSPQPSGETWIGDWAWVRVQSQDVGLVWTPDVYRWRISAKAVDPGTGLPLTEVRGNVNTKGQDTLVQSWDTKVY
jgi:hypothetical protein